MTAEPGADDLASWRAFALLSSLSASLSLISALSLSNLNSDSCFWRLLRSSANEDLSDSGPFSWISLPISSRSSLIIVASSNFSSRSARFSDASCDACSALSDSS